MKIDILELGSDRANVLCEGDRKRERVRSSHGEVVIDRFDAAGVEIRFLRLRPEPDDDTVSLVADLDDPVELANGWGILGRDDVSPGSKTIWIPRPPRPMSVRDHAGRSKIGDQALDGWRIAHDGELRCRLPADRGDVIWSLSMVVFDDADGEQRHHVEWLSRQSWPVLMKSDWFRADSPVDLWDALIDGDVFDPRPSTCDCGRFRCQQCALAWWSYLRIAGESSGSDVMRLLATELAWSIRLNLDEPGGWRHGFWREDAETHLRFYLDGIGLLLVEASLAADRSWHPPIDRAVDVVLDRYSDTLADGGLWFLHDSLEAAGIAPPHPTPRLGQSPGNTLCLNTHIQALTVLGRAAKIFDSEASGRIGSAYERGMAALQRILELDSAPMVYRVLGSWVRPAVESKGSRGFRARMTRVLVFRVFPRLYWWIRRQFPRIVYPNGFIERDMASSMLADDYHVVNLKDLLNLFIFDPQPWLWKVIEDARLFLASLDIEKALKRSPLFLEVDDVTALYDAIVEESGRKKKERSSMVVRVKKRQGADSLDLCFMQSGEWKRRIIAETPHCRFLRESSSHGSPGSSVGE